MFNIENEKLSKIWNNPVLCTKVERRFAASLSPRCQEWIEWDKNHHQTPLKPTEPSRHHHEKVNPKMKAFDKEMNERFEKRRLETPPELRISTNL